MKPCRTCSVWQPYERFAKSRSRAGGYENQCAACRTAQRNAPKPTAHLPVWPLNEYIKRQYPKGSFWESVTETTARRVEKIIERGTINPFNADEVAVHVFAVHPVAIWGELWWEWGLEVPTRARDRKKTA